MKTRQLISAAAITLCSGICGAQVPGDSDAPVTVYTAKKIITMNPGWPEGTAVAVQGDRIVSVGRTLEDLKPWTDGHATTIDRSFEGKVLVPGFVDPHQHVLPMAIIASLPNVAYYDTAMPYGPAKQGLKTKEAVIERLREYDRSMKNPNDVLVAWGYDAVACGGHLDKAQLDAISTTRPIYVWDASEHNGYLNTAMLQRAKLTEAFKKVPGVTLDAQGDFTGVFIGNNASLPILLPLVGAMLSPQNLTPLLRSGADLMRRGGITSYGDLAWGIVNRKLEEGKVAEFLQRPDVPLRANAVIHAATYAALPNYLDYVHDLQKSNTNKFRYSGVKFFSDDSFVALGMQIGSPGYVDGHKGIWLTPPERLAADMAPWWNAGFRIHVHSNGQDSQSAVVDTLARLQADHPRFDHRFTFEHVGILGQTQADRMAALGAQASVNGWYPYLRGEFNAPHFGTDRSHSSSPLRTMLTAGLRVGLHHDTPVAAPLPLTSMWVAVNRFGQSGKVMAAEERVNVQQALRMVTLDAARMIGMEDIVGSIEAGKMADFTVLEENPLAVKPERIKDIKIWGVVFAGKKLPDSEIRPMTAVQVNPPQAAFDLIKAPLVLTSHADHDDIHEILYEVLAHAIAQQGVRPSF
jgi:predicted amidohydrolase YtcJ